MFINIKIMNNNNTFFHDTIFNNFIVLQLDNSDCNTFDLGYVHPTLSIDL